MNSEDIYIKFELKNSDIVWLNKLNNKLWHNNYDFAKKIHYSVTNAPLQSKEWHGLLALINIYDLPLILKDGNSIYDIKLEIYGHSNCIGVSPDIILKLSPFHFRDFNTSYKINSEVKLFIQHLLPLINTNRNKELINVYGLKTISKERLFSLKVNYL